MFDDTPGATLWWTNILPWKITMFNGKIHYKWPCSTAMLVHQVLSDRPFPKSPPSAPRRHRPFLDQLPRSRCQTSTDSRRPRAAWGESPGNPPVSWLVKPRNMGISMGKIVVSKWVIFHHHVTRGWIKLWSSQTKLMRARNVDYRWLYPKMALCNTVPPF